MQIVAPVLATPIEPGALDHYLTSDDWMADQKCDGWRCLVHIENGIIAPTSRSGKPIVAPQLVAAFAPFAVTGLRWVLDGEWLRTGRKQGVYQLFDLVDAPAEAVASLLHDQPASDLPMARRPLRQRRLALERLFAVAGFPDCVQLLPAASTSAAKAALVAQVQSTGGEGVVFKRADAAYAAGPSTKVVKLKFRNDVDAVVTAVGLDGKSNMALSLYDEDGELVPVGECGALTGDGPDIAALFATGAEVVVTVVYQYAFQDATRPRDKRYRLVMPTLPRLRHDKAARECALDQLVYANKAILAPCGV